MQKETLRLLSVSIVDALVRLPLYGSIQAAMKNIEPDFIEITVFKKIKVSHTYWYSGMNR